MHVCHNSVCGWVGASLYRVCNSMSGREVQIIAATAAQAMPCLTAVPWQSRMKFKFPLTRSNGVGGMPSKHHDPQEKAEEGVSV